MLLSWNDSELKEFCMSSLNELLIKLALIFALTVVASSPAVTVVNVYSVLLIALVISASVRLTLNVRVVDWLAIVS